MTVIKQQATDTEVSWALPAGGSFTITDETGTELFRVTASGDTVKLPAGGLTYAGTAVTSTGTELNALDGITSTVSELNILDTVTATASEINTLASSGIAGSDLVKLAAVTASAAELNALDFDDIEARTTTAAGDGTGVVSDGKLVSVVAVTSASADNILTLPTPTPGSVVIAYVGANGYELRSDTPASVAIGGGSEANAESAIPANSIAVAFCISATAWVGFTVTAATLAAIEAAAAA